MKKLVRKVFLYVMCLLVMATSIATPAFAASKWDVSFEFDGPGKKPLPKTMRDYIMGCVPKGSFVPAPPPPAYPEGPFALTTPGSLTDKQVYDYINNCNLKPASVTGVVVLGED